MSPSPAEHPLAHAAAAQDLVAEAATGPRRPLPPGWRDDPVRVLIAMVLADPTPEGIARALAWFYGRGLPDPHLAAPDPSPLDPAALLRDVLERAADSVGLDTLRARFYEALGEEPPSPGGERG